MKTKVEIIEETANFYDLNNRGTIYGFNKYFTSDGKQCAVGRCLIDPIEFQNVFRNGSITLITDPVYNINLDEYFKKEYRGHDSKFWSDLQRFHDDPSNWDERGLTEYGIKSKKNLIIKYE